MHTLYLNPSNWDITLDSSGRLEHSAGAYAVAQNVANAVRLFTNDAFFAKDEGIPHFDIELGRKPSPALLRARIRAAALNVEGVKAAAVTLDEIQPDRKISGIIELTVTDGVKETSVTITI